MLLAADLGGTALKLALVDGQSRLICRREVSVSFDGYRTPLIVTTERAIRALLQETGATIAGIAVSATGQIDAAVGTVAGSNGSIPGYEGTPIRGHLERAFRLPVHVLNDANAALLGEMTAGAARGLSDVLMVTLGTGVGGAFVSGGRLLSGSRGLAGEIGHMLLHPGGEACTCGQRGCYERYASTGALLRRAQAALGRPGLDGQALFVLAQQGDPQALALLKAWFEDISLGIISLVHLLNPQLVLLGGGVCRQELLLSSVRRLVLSGVMPCFARELRLESAALGNDAGLVGAAQWWRQCAEKGCETSPSPV